MKYTVNEFAKLIGISAETLRHYDRIGLISPQRKADNHYREYSFSDILPVLEICRKKTLGMSLSEISEIMGGKSISEQRLWLQEKEREIDIQIRQLEKTKAFYNSAFSELNKEEIASGAILKADTIEELAALCELDAETLKQTIADWNACCEAGVDVKFERDPKTLKPLNGPFYAMKLVPTMLNTQGGPERNTEAEIINLAGEPIPHLYSAGELGAMWPDMYNGGGNLGECTIFGRIAGNNAAAVKEDTIQDSLMNGKTPVDFTLKAEAIDTAANEYLGKARGLGGELTVKVTMDGTAIAAVEVVSHNETAGVADKALEQVPAAIVAAQSADVDIVSGASMTSRAIMEAVKQAMEQIAK